MADDIVQVTPEDDEIEEQWNRNVDDDFREVGVDKPVGADYWRVFVGMADLVRHEPLESIMRQRIAAALSEVPGATEVAEEDREVWVVSGAPSGPALIAAVGLVVDVLADQARAELG